MGTTVNSSVPSCLPLGHARQTRQHPVWGPEEVPVQKFVDGAQNLYHAEVFLIPFGNDRVAGGQMDPFTSRLGS